MARLAVHLGDQLAEELEALDMSAAELARQLKAGRIIKALPTLKRGRGGAVWPA